MPFWSKDPEAEPDDGSDERGEIVQEEAKLPDPDHLDLDCVEPNDEYNR